MSDEKSEIIHAISQCNHLLSSVNWQISAIQDDPTIIPWKDTPSELRAELNLEVDLQDLFETRERLESTLGHFERCLIVAKSEGRWTMAIFIPSKIDIADTFLLFACKSPEEAEAAVGDLLEEYDVVRARRSAITSNIWFIWQLSWLFVAKAKQRVIKSAFGSVLDKWIGPS